MAIDWYATPRPDAQLEALKAYFTRFPQVDRRFKYVDYMGSGSYGACVRLRELWENGTMRRDIVIKQANTEAHRQELRWEIDRLKRIAGGLHIVQLLDIENSPFFDFDVDEPGLAQFNPDRARINRAAYESEGYLLGPMLAIELLENGSVKDFIQKAQAHNVPRLPNRLIWRFFLCLVRACVAMAYPRRSGKEQFFEVIPAGDQAPSDFTHTDWQPGNVMLGGIYLEHFEHQITPILKLIDFGVWQDAVQFNLLYNDLNEKGVAHNIFGAASVIFSTIALDLDLYIVWDTPVQFTVQRDGQTRSIATLARDMVQNLDSSPKYAHLDRELVSVIAQCLASNPADRPSLPDLFNWLLQGVMRSPADYDVGVVGGNAQETDLGVLELLQRIIYEAPPPS
ncbi:hypothetical protein PG993_007804 [Apiospora rasikravindrae]|uniref:Protein kinase domain-containing protein n=1 Tax=Apiospora rasikravindrae TaxID=990691 RepID=A0ABR1T0T4_9PEZI